ncbi:unnamed protein product [Larinioides sclopetarius]|uniref:PiggyBac transposable element-derived protein domain-containing protein n=1 Tax=Larinioides sclopetarius TaxID=280406 RepID=A0AAV2BYR2_9ARAC
MSSIVAWPSFLSAIYQKQKSKFGVKLYELCESQGTLLRVQIYCGKSELSSNDQNHSTSVVFSLMDGFLDIGHVLYMDNFYNSVSLAKQLTLRSTYVCGTLRLNRKDQKYAPGRRLSRKSFWKPNIGPLAPSESEELLEFSEEPQGPDCRNSCNSKFRLLGHATM